MSGKKLLIKQLVKYFVLIIVFLTSLFLARVLWLLPARTQVIGLIVGVVLLLILLAFDIASTKDVIPIIKR